MTAVLVGQAFSLLLAVFVLWLVPTLVRPTLPFGVRVPPERANAPVVTEQRRSYRERVAAGGTVLVALAVALGAVTGQPLVATAATLALLGLALACYALARRAILAAKEREGWYEHLRQGVAVDTSLRTAPPPFPWAWAIPAVAILVATAVLGAVRYPHLPATLVVHYGASGAPDGRVAKSVGSAFSLVFLQAAVTALLGGLTLATFRARADLDAAQPATTASQHRRYVVLMARGMLLLAALVNLSMLVAAWLVWRDAGPSATLLLAVQAPVLLGAAGLVALTVRTGQAGSRLPAGGEAPTGLVQRDDDRCWRGGLIYVNPDDPAILVPKRFGIGWTLNFARGGSWLLLAGTIAGAVLVSVLLGHGS